MVIARWKKSELTDLYLNHKKSVHEIACIYACSASKVDYWLSKFKIPKRSISEAIYIKRNPQGDPFLFKPPQTKDEMFLFGLGVGLYWGEGNKKNKNTIRLGNTDPRLVKKFVDFMIHFYAISEKKFRFGLQIFSDMDPEKALRFWVAALGVSRTQFGKVVVTPARGVGTYREKTKYGVLTVYVSNKKLKDLLFSELEKL